MHNVRGRISPIHDLCNLMLLFIMVVIVLFFSLYSISRFDIFQIGECRICDTPCTEPSSSAGEWHQVVLLGSGTK